MARPLGPEGSSPRPEAQRLQRYEMNMAARSSRTAKELRDVSSSNISTSWVMQAFSGSI